MPNNTSLLAAFFQKVRLVGRKSKGFTLIELLVVISIIALLSMVAIVTFTQATVNSRNARRRSDLAQLQSALVIYRSDVGTYPIYAGQSSTANYTTMAAELQSKGYFNEPPTAGPLGSQNDAYGYSSDAAGRTFSVCATLERTTPATLCLRNP